MTDHKVIVRSEEEAAPVIQEDGMTFMRPVIAIATITLWFVLTVLGVASVWGPSWQSRFLDAATKVLLPVFNATVVASLTYIFGKPVAAAVVRRLSRR